MMRTLALLALMVVAAGRSPAAGQEAAVPDEAALLAGADERILRNRTAPLVVEVRHAGGGGVGGARVRVEHLRHRFFFGAGFDQRLLPRAGESEADRRHRENFLRLFNYATVHLYWQYYEPRRGDHLDGIRREAIEWLRGHGLVARGHPVFWNHRAGLPGWVSALEPAPDDLVALLDERLEQLSETVLPGLRDVDVFNELTRWERFDNCMTRLLADRGKVPLVARYLAASKRRNPGLLTVVNDYDTTPDYPRLLGRLIEAGAPVDIIGQQSHMHSGNWPAAKLWTVMERLAALDRPVLFTELSVLSGPQRRIDWKTEDRVDGWETDPEHEQAQADYLERFYRLVYGRPDTIGIVIWNYSDRGAWLGAPVGVLRRDGTPKPSFERLDRLINHEWRTSGEFTADDSGRLEIPAAHEGSYRVTVGGESRTGEHARSAPLRLRLDLD